MKYIKQDIDNNIDLLKNILKVNSFSELCVSYKFPLNGKSRKYLKFLTFIEI